MLDAVVSPNLHCTTVSVMSIKIGCLFPSYSWQWFPEYIYCSNEAGLTWGYELSDLDHWCCEVCRTTPSYRKTTHDRGIDLELT